MKKLNDIKLVSPSGLIISVNKPTKLDVNLYDIAKGLGQIKRFKGDTVIPHSVARHSVICSYMVPSEFAAEALFHDAPEAYLGDMITPVKAFCKGYQKLEAKWYKAVAERYNLNPTISKTVKDADRKLFEAECVRFLRKENKENILNVCGITPTLDSLLVTIETLHEIPPATTCDWKQFMERANELGIYC